MNELARIVPLAPILMLGLMAGFFYAFSVCVMAGLDAIAPGNAITAMQAINAAVRNPVFFITFFLTPVVAVGASVLAFTGGDTRLGFFMAAAAAVYVLAAISPTAMVNVPINEALATLDPAQIDASAVWSDYSARWTFWNTVRTLTTTLALAVALFPLIESR